MGSDRALSPLRLFISYRRKDTSSDANRLHEILAERFGADNVFIDVDSVEYGVDFKQAIEAAVSQCDVLFAIIGPRWLTIRSGGKRRLEHEDDYVRLELEAALAQNVRVIPVLFQGARMPHAQVLPPSLAPLALRNAIVISDGPHYRFDVGRLIGLLERIRGGEADAELSPGSEPADAMPPRRDQLRPRRHSPDLRLVAIILALVAAVATGAYLLTTRHSETITSGAPVAVQRGGILKLLAYGDVSNLDTVSANVATSNRIARTYTRQLVTYPSTASFAQSNKPVPDIAIKVPTYGDGISADGKTYVFKLRHGVMWDSSPPRQVTADDFVREFKLLCNPASPIPVPRIFESTIVGMRAYCDGFSKVKPSVSAIARYVHDHRLAGVVARDPSTLEFSLLHPALDFFNILATGFGSARPVEYMQYIPDSKQLRTHMLSDGPYRITQYVPGQSMLLERNPAWKPGSDDVRHAYVDAIRIVRGFNSITAQRQLEAGKGDLAWDIGPLLKDVQRLLVSRDPRLIVAPPGLDPALLSASLALNQYAGPMKSKLVREAVATAVDKQAIVRILGGSTIGDISNQMVLPDNLGYVPGFNAFPANQGDGNPGAARALLRKAGYRNGLPIKLLTDADYDPEVDQAIEASLNAAGFKVATVPVPDADYLPTLSQPTAAKADTWDLADMSWAPLWFGNSGRALLQPLFTAPGPGTDNVGGYDNPVTTRLMEQALATASEALAAKLWARANRQTMKDVAAVPLSTAKVVYVRSSRVRNCNYLFAAQTCDLTNVWLKRR